MMSQIHILKYFFFFFLKQADDFAALPVHTYTETWILHILHDMCSNSAHHCLPEIVSYLVEYLYSVCFLSTFIRHPGQYFFKSDTYSAMKHFLSIIFCLLHIFCISHFPQNIISSLLASSRLSLLGLEVCLIHLNSPYLLQILALSIFFLI